MIDLWMIDLIYIKKSNGTLKQRISAALKSNNEFKNKIIAEKSIKNQSVGKNQV